MNRITQLKSAFFICVISLFVNSCHHLEAELGLAQAERDNARLLAAQARTVVEQTQAAEAKAEAERLKRIADEQAKKDREAQAAIDKMKAIEEEKKREFKAEQERLANMGSVTEVAGQPLRAHLDVTGESASNELLVPLRDSMSQAGMVFDQQHPELVMAVTVKTKQFDKSGNYYIMDGEAIAEARLAVDKRLLGNRTFTQRGDRQLGLNEATADVTSKLAQQLRPWTLTALTGKNVGVVATRIEITVPKNVDVHAYSSQIQTVLRSLNDVLKVEPLPVANRDIAFRVVYVRGSISSGIPALLTARDELQLKRR